MTLSLNIGNFFNDSSSHALVDQLREKTTKKEILEFEEKPLFAQLLPFANVMTEKVQVVNALAFTLIMGVSIFGIALWRLSALT